METHHRFKSEYDLDVDKINHTYGYVREKILTDYHIGDYERDVRLTELDTWYDKEKANLLSGGSYQGDALLVENGFQDYLPDYEE